MRLVHLEVPEAIIAYADRPVRSPLAYRLGLALDTSFISSLRFALSKWLDRAADVFRPTASMSDIRVGMSREMERKVRTAILAAWNSTSYATAEAATRRMYVPIDNETAEAEHRAAQHREWLRRWRGEY